MAVRRRRPLFRPPRPRRNRDIPVKTGQLHFAAFAKALPVHDRFVRFPGLLSESKRCGFDSVDHYVAFCTEAKLRSKNDSTFFLRLRAKKLCEAW